MSTVSYSKCPDSINLVEEAPKHLIKSKKKRFDAEEFKRQINSTKKKRIKKISDSSDSDSDRPNYQNNISISRSDSECDRGTTVTISELNHSNSNNANDDEMENSKDELHRTKIIQKNNNLSNRSKKALESEDSQSDPESDHGIVLKSSKSSLKHVLSSDDSSEENNGSRMRKRPALQSSSSDEDEKA